MTPEQYDAIVARQTAISAKIEALQALLVVGLTMAVVVIVLCLVIIYVKRYIYAEVITLLDTVRKEAKDIDTLLSINKEYVQRGDMKREESRAAISDQIKNAVGEGIQQAAASGPISSTSMPRPVLPNELP